MNEFEKEIEEMARDIEKYVVRDWSNELYIGSSQRLYNAGYRNVKDKVVLSKEEYEELRQERSDYITELQETHNENCRLRIELEDIRKETTREIIEFAKSFFTYDEEGFVKELIEQYGVE